MESKAALREEVTQILAADSKVTQMLQPVSLNAAIADSRAEDKGQIYEMMQTCWQQDALRESISPDSHQSTGLEEILELHDGMLHSRPYQAEKESYGNHHGKAHSHHKGRAFENPQPVGDIGIIEAVVEPGRHTSNEDSSQHAHVQSLDIGYHGQPRACSRFLAVINPEVSAVQSEEAGNEIIEEHVDDKALHSTAGRLLLGKTDGHGDGKEDRHLGEHRPGTLFYYKPEIIPKSSLGSQAAQDSLILANNCQGYRKTKECKQDNRRIHCTAKPLHPLHDTILTERHVHYLLYKSISIPSSLRFLPQLLSKISYGKIIIKKARESNSFAGFRHYCPIVEHSTFPVLWYIHHSRCRYMRYCTYHTSISIKYGIMDWKAVCSSSSSYRANLAGET